MKGTCETCTHYCALQTQCRRNPPTAVMFAVDQQRNLPVFAASWPPVGKDAWCGEYARDEGATLTAIPGGRIA